MAENEELLPGKELLDLSQLVLCDRRYRAARACAR